jgi:hypothetical protein
MKQGEAEEAVKMDKVIDIVVVVVVVCVAAVVEQH